MDTQDIILTIQYITVGVLFAEIWIVFSGWKNSIHSYLFLACVSTFVSNLGYLLELQATTGEAYLTALKLSYAGRVWISFLLFLFAAKMCRIRIPRWVVAVLGLIHTVIYLTILTIGSNGAYYTSYEFIPDPVSPVFHHTNGRAHDLLMGMNCVCICGAGDLVAGQGISQRKKQEIKVKVSVPCHVIWCSDTVFDCAAFRSI